MKRFGPLVLCLMAGCAAPSRPVSKAPPSLHHLVLPKRLALAPKPLLLTEPRTNTVPWIYPSWLNPSNYCWTLQSSSNLIDWVDVPGACVSDPLYGFATDTAGFWRLKGVR